MMVKEPISNLKEGQYEENKTIQLTSKTIGVALVAGLNPTSHDTS